VIEVIAGNGWHITVIKPHVGQRWFLLGDRGRDQFKEQK
jgi:hypothetical protein